jgi:transcriptional regulator with XRE-family HTH domain
MVEVGSRPRAVRKATGLSQDTVGTALGMKPFRGHAYVSDLEKGKLLNVGFLTVVRYLQACKAPIGRFMLELAQSGAFGEAEQGLTIVDDRGKAEEAKRAKAKLRSEKRWEREARDADIIARLWNEVQVAIRPLLPRVPTIFLSHYLEGVRAFYRAWKRATRGAVNRTRPRLFPQAPHPRGFAPEDGKPGAIRASFPVTPLGEERDVRMAFDRIEQAGLRVLVPAALHKMREIVFERLMARIPVGGNS